MPEPAVHQLFIAGRWVDSVSGATFESVNPADTRDVVGRFQAGTAADVAMTVRAAEEGSKGWKATHHGLSASIFTRDVNTAFRAMRDFEPGIVYINAGTTGAETHLPFGGWKDTGNGHREAGHVALDTFTEWKSVNVDVSGKLQRAQIDNQPS